MTVSRSCARVADELGLDAVGAAPAAPYEDTERHIRERRARGLFGSMRFTMAQPEVSCHPETLLDGARTVVSAALCYYAPAPEPRPGEGRLPRYAWRDHYALLRDRLDALGRRLGGAYRVLVDENQHVDRAGAERAGVGFIGKNTMLITRSARLVGRARHARHRRRARGDARRSMPAAGAARSASTPVRRGRSTSRACSTRRGVSRTGRRRRRRCPSDVMEELEDRVYGCDICQDVCPWNRGVEKRRAGDRARGRREPTVSLVAWLEGDGAALVEELDRLYVPRNDPRWLRRNALVALGNVGRPGDEQLAEPFLDGRRARASPRPRAGRVERIAGATASERARAGSTCSRHELRSPVAALDGARRAATAARHGLGGAPRGCVELAVAAGRDVERLVSDPELFSLRLERVDVGGARARASRLRERRPSRVARRRRSASADPTRLRQALANLVANGLRHGSRVAIEVAGGGRPSSSST